MHIQHVILIFLDSYKGKTYKWGYFPKLNAYNLDELFVKKKNSEMKLLWVGRLVGWKHPECAIEIAKMLKDDGYNFKLEIIGTGEMLGNLEELIKSYKLENRVKILGSMSPEKVREKMEQANIFLFTSDFNEGWGAVLNESMNSGCAVVASHAIGSVPFLIEHGQNGLIYKNDSIDDFFIQVKKLMDNKKLCNQLGENAYNTLKEKWNAEIAANRLISLFDSKLKGQEFHINDGPCSKAEPIKQNEMYDIIIK